MIITGVSNHLLSNFPAQVELHTTETWNSKHPIFSFINIDAFHTKMFTKIKTNKQRTQVLLQILLWLNPLYRDKLTHRTPSSLWPSTDTSFWQAIFKFKFYFCNMNKILCFRFDSKVIIFFCFNCLKVVVLYGFGPPKLLSKCLASVLIQSLLSRQFLGSPDFLWFYTWFIS